LLPKGRFGSQHVPIERSGAPLALANGRGRRRVTPAGRGALTQLQVVHGLGWTARVCGPYRYDLMGTLKISTEGAT
jgi:hypothetical protein